MRQKWISASCIARLLFVGAFGLTSLWGCFLVYVRWFGAQVEVTRKIPSAMVYAANTEDLSVKSLFQDMLPGGYVLPNSIINIKIQDTKLNIHDILNIEFDYLYVERCQVYDWDVLFEGYDLSGRNIVIYDSSFERDVGEASVILEGYRTDESGRIVYSFGGH